MKYAPPTPEIKGWMNEDELQWLYDQATQSQSIVEIGCWFGRSTHALLSGCPGLVTVVDTFRGAPGESAQEFAHRGGDVYGTFMANVGHFPNLRVHRMYSAVAAAVFPDRSVDMVFIDGDHRYEIVLDDIHQWRRKATRILCGHDCGQDGVPQALKESGLKWQQGPSTIWWADMTDGANLPPITGRLHIDLSGVRT